MSYSELLAALENKSVGEDGHERVVDLALQASSKEPAQESGVLLERQRYQGGKGGKDGEKNSRQKGSGKQGTGEMWQGKN